MIKPQQLSEAADSRGGRATLQTDQAYMTLKEMILLADVPPLAPLDEKKLMVELGLGRTPIREALQRLAQEDLVLILPYRGMFAAGIDMTDLDEIMECRVPLEVKRIRLAAERATDEQAHDLRVKLSSDETQGLVRAGDVKSLREFDSEFHRSIAVMANNRYIEKTLTNLRDFTWRFHVLFYRKRAPNYDDYMASYLAVLEALEAHNQGAAEAAIMAYLTLGSSIVQVTR